MNFLAKTTPLRQAGVPSQGREFSKELGLLEPSRVYLNIGPEDVASFTRVGNDLVMVVCGEVIRIAGFFLPEAQSELFLRGAAGEALQVQLDTAGVDGEIIARFFPQPEAAPFQSLTAPAACLIAPESEAGLSSLGAALGAVLGAAVLGSRSSSGSNSDPTPPVPDTRAPQFLSAAVSANGAVLTLVYDETLDASRPPVPGSFVVQVNGVAVAVTAVSVVGASVVLTLASPVPPGAAVTVAYTDPSAGNDASAVQDAAGNDAASLAPTGVTNPVGDGTPPAFVSASTSANGATLVLTYDEALDAAHPPAAASFVVNVNGTPVVVTGVAVVGNTVVLTLASAVAAGAQVTVAYTDGSAGNDANAIQDAAGNDAASLAPTGVNNLVADGVTPTFVSAATSTNGATLVLTYDEALDGAHPPAATSFTVNVNGVAVAVTGVSVVGSTVVLTLATPVANGAVVTVAYADPTAGNDANAIQDLSGNDAASLVPTSVGNLVPDGAAPAFVSAVTSADGATLVLTYGEALDAAHPPAAASFVVRVNGVAVAVTGVTVVGSSVVLTLATAVVNGAAVTIAYDDPSTGNDANAIQDAAGNDAASLATTGVANMVADSTPPAFVSAATSSSGSTLVLSYDEVLDAAHPPASGSFLVHANGTPVMVTGVAVVGSTVVLTLASPIAHGVAVTVAYADPTPGNDGNAIQDAAGNDALSLAPTGVNNLVPDGVTPTFVSAATSANGATLVLTYDEALDGAHPPAATSFTVNVNGVAVAVTGVSVAGSTVVLTLATPVANGAVVTVAYADPTAGNDANAIQDAEGNDAASLLTTGVNNLVPDSAAPVFVSAATSADGATLALTYGEALDPAHPPVAASFVVNVNGSAVAVTGVSVAGNGLLLTLATAVPHGASVTVAYADPTPGNDANAIQDAAGNDAASLPATTVSNLVPDSTPPAFLTASTSADGATLVLTYDEALDAANLPAAGSFVVNVNGAAVAVTGVAVSGSGVVLTLATAVAHGAVVTVAYNDATAGNDANAIQDAAGNDAASLPPTGVANLVPDSTAPTFVSAVTSADGAGLVLTYSEALDAANPPAAGSFVVNVNGVAVAVTAVAVNGASVVLTLATAVTNGAAVTVVYNDPSAGNDANAVQDAFGNDAASLPTTNVGNLVPDVTPPAFVSAATGANGATLVLSYSEALDAAHPPAAGSFTVNVNGVAVAVTGVGVVGSSVVLSLATPVANGAVVTVAYADPTAGNDGNAIQDAAGNDAPSLPLTAVNNLVPDGVTPTFVSATTSPDGARVVLTYDEALDAVHPPTPGSFVVNVNGVAVAVTGVAVVGSTVVLTLAAPVTNGAAVSVAYNDATPGNDANAIQDAAGNDAASLPTTGVGNAVPDSTAPAFVSAVTSADGATLVLTYNEALDAANPPAAGSFVVSVNGVAVAVTGVSVVGSTVVLTLATPVANGAAVTVAYGDPTAGNDANAIQDAAGNDAASLPATNVGNLVPDGTPPAFVSAATSADGTSLVLRYSETLDAANPPVAASFVVTVNGVAVVVTGVSVLGSSVVLALASPVANGAAVTVAYADPSPGNDASAVQDAAGNDAASMAATNVSNLVPDSTPPAFVSAATSSSGGTLVLTYDEALDAGNPPAAGSFVVNVNGAAVAVTGVSVVGSTVVLTLATPVANGATVTVAYNDPTAGNDGSAVQDAAGNDALSLAPAAVNNLVPDGITPTFVSAAISADGATLVLTYDEALDAAHPPAAGSFTVNVNGAAVAVTGVNVVGSTVVLTLASPVTNGANVTVAYADPTAGNDANAVQDAEGNDAASLIATSVSNQVADTVAPTFVSAVTSADGSQLVLTYNEALDAGNPPVAGSFTVNVNGVAVSVTAVTITGNTVALALASPVANGAAVTVAYADTTAGNDGAAIQDAAGNDAASLPATAVSNLVPDSTAPVFVSATTSADGATLVLAYSAKHSMPRTRRRRVVSWSMSMAWRCRSRP